VHSDSTIRNIYAKLEKQTFNGFGDLRVNGEPNGRRHIHGTRQIQSDAMSLLELLPKGVEIKN